MSTYVLARHALSGANDRNNIGSMAFASEQAPLIPLGIEQAQTMGGVIIAKYGIDITTEPVATSDMLRTQQTASEAGFQDITPYAALDEIRHGMDLQDLRGMLDEGELPPIAIKMAKETLANPPRERFWVAHGLRIAGICAVLGVHKEKRLIPKFCELREIELG